MATALCVSGSVTAQEEIGAARVLQQLLLLGWRFAVPDVQWAYQGTDTNAYARARIPFPLACLIALVKDSWTPSVRLAKLSLVGIVALGLYPIGSVEQFLRVGRRVAPATALMGGIAVWASATHTQGLAPRPVSLPSKPEGSPYGLYLWHPAVLILFWSRIDGDRGLIALGAIASLDWTSH